MDDKQTGILHERRAAYETKSTAIDAQHQLIEGSGDRSISPEERRLLDDATQVEYLAEWRVKQAEKALGGSVVRRIIKWIKPRS